MKKVSIPPEFKKWLEAQNKPMAIFVDKDGDITCETGMVPYTANLILGKYLEDAGHGVLGFDYDKFVDDWENMWE